MIRLVSSPTWGANILQDTETGTFSFQCVCGGIGMYWQRVVLTPDEAEEVQRGTFDADQMVNDICKRTPRVAERIVDALDPSLLTQDDGDQKS